MVIERYRFRDFVLDPSARELWQGETLVALPSRAFDCLVYLVRHRDRAVGRDELIAAVWGRVDIADTLLAQTILRLRRTLGDDAAQGAVRTVSRFGYRWVEPTQRVDADDALPAQVDAEVPPVAQVDAAPSPSMPITPERARRKAASWQLAAIAGAALVALLAVVLWSTTGDPGRREPVASEGATAPATSAELGSPEELRSAYRSVIVLPADVPDLPDWTWLRLGLMELLGHRLRLGGLPALPSEDVLSLLDDDGQPGAGSIDADTLVVQPVVRRRDAGWLVRLDLPQVRGAPNVQATADEPVRAAHDVADLLLIRLGRAPSEPPDAQPLDLADLLLRVRAAALGDRFDVALQLIDQAAPSLRGHPELSLARARIEQGQGRYGEAEHRLLALRDEVQDSADPILRGRVSGAVGTVLFRRSNLDAADRAFAEAIELLHGRNDPIATGQALMGRAAVYSRREDLDASESDLGRARTEMEAGGDLLGVAQIDMNLGLIQIKRYRPAIALPLLREAENRFVTFGAREELAYSRYVIAGAQLQLLDLAGAAETVGRFWPPDAHTANERLRWRLALSRAFVLSAAGQLSAAQAQIDEIRQGTDDADDAAVLGGVDALSALIAAMRGEHDRAVSALHAVLTPALREQRPDMFVTVWMAYLRSLRQVGQMERAAEETRRFATWIDDQPNPWREVQRELAWAEQVQVQGGATAALERFERAFDLAQRLAIPEDLVHVAEPYTAALIEAGQIDRASAVVGRVAAWADQDVRAAWAQAQLFRAQGRNDAWRRAMARVEQLRGERVLPAAGSG